MYSGAIGYNFSPLLSADIEYIYRPSYSYKVFQTPTPEYSSYSARTRFFDLQSNSLMANAYLHGKGISQRLNWITPYGFNIEPFIGGGLGVAFNTVSNFHTVLVTGSSLAYEQDKLRTSLAWQLSAGLNFYNDGDFNLGAGYRYYNGETFSSNDSSIDYLLPNYAWRGTIQANEFFVTLAYKIDA